MVIHRNQQGLLLYLLDRSRLETAQECLRKYYYLYGFLGIGIVKVREVPYWPFISGHYIHEGIEAILKGVSGIEAADKAGAEYKREWGPKIAALDLGPDKMAITELELEQEVDLVKGLIYGWYLVGYPRFLSNYVPIADGIEQEEEISWLLDGDGQAEMKLMTRTDILARSNNGQVTLFNLKSVSDPNDRWRVSFTRDMQTLTEAMAVEARLGFKVDGIIIEGLVKGSKSEWPKGSGFWQYRNELIYCWVKVNEAPLPGEEPYQYEPSWEYSCTAPHVMGNGSKCVGGRNHTLGKGWRKQLVSITYPGGIYSWIGHLMRDNPSILDSYFIQLPAISRDEFQVERWKRQKLHIEKARQDAAAAVDNEFIRGDKESAYLLLDHYFNMNEGYWCYDCAYNGLCWEAGDPFDEGKWKARVPNHLLEAESLVQIK